MKASRYFWSGSKTKAQGARVKRLPSASLTLTFLPEKFPTKITSWESPSWRRKERTSFGQSLSIQTVSPSVRALYRFRMEAQALMFATRSRAWGVS